MSEPPREPYRKEPDLLEVIPPDRRMRERAVLAITSAAVSAVVASLVTLAGVRLTRGPAPQIVVAAPAAAPAPLATETAAATACVIPPGMDPARGPAVLALVPRYPGAVLRTSFNVGAGTASVGLETCDSVDDVVTFYRNTQGLDSDGEREAQHGRELFFSKISSDTTVEVFKVSIIRERGTTKITIGEGTPRRRVPPAAAADKSPRRPTTGLPDLNDRF